MLQRSCAAGCDDRDADALCDRSCQLDIVSRLCSVAVHAGEQNFSGSEALGFFRPLDGVDADIDPAAVFVDIPAASVSSLLRIDRNDHALAAKFLRRIVDQLRIVDCGGVDRNFVGSLAEQHLEIVYGTDSAADGEWDEDVCCYFAHHIDDRSSLIGGGGDVEEHNFIGSCLVIRFCNLHRVSSIF